MQAQPMMSPGEDIAVVIRNKALAAKILKIFTQVHRNLTEISLIAEELNDNNMKVFVAEMEMGMLKPMYGFRRHIKDAYDVFERIN